MELLIVVPQLGYALSLAVGQHQVQVLAALYVGSDGDAFDDAEATRRFEEWMKQNETKIEAKRSGLEKSKEDEMVRRLAEEKKINDARAEKLAKRQAEIAAKEEAATKPDSPAEESVAEDTTAEADSTEQAPSVEDEQKPVAEEPAPPAADEEKPQE